MRRAKTSLVHMIGGIRVKVSLDGGSSIVQGDEYHTHTKDL